MLPNANENAAVKNLRLECPACRTMLVPGEAKRYQTMDEHICCPNRRHAARATLICPNQACRAHWGKVYWAEDGEGPYNTYGARDPIAWIDDNPMPFGSCCRAEYFSSSCYDKEDKSWTVGRLTVHRKVRYRSDDYGHKTGRTTEYTVYWDGTLWIPGYQMLLFELQNFYRIKNNPWMIEREIKGLEKRSRWPKAEWWRKASVWWIKTAHRDLYQKALQHHG